MGEIIGHLAALAVIAWIAWSGLRLLMWGEMTFFGRSWKPRGAKVIGVILLLWGGMGVLTTLGRGCATVSQRARVGGALDSLTQVPELEHEFAGLTSERKLAKMQALMSGGLSRLPDTLLVERAELINMILPRLPESAATELATGHLSGSNSDAFDAALMALGSNAYGKWLSICQSAMIAEVQERPVPELNDSTVAAAFLALRVDMPEAEFQRLVNSMSHPEAGTEPTWMMRTLYYRAMRLPPANRHALLRMLVQPAKTAPSAR